MFRKTLLTLVACSTCFPTILVAQEDPAATTSEKPKTEETAGPNRFWQATLGGGHFMVALDRISSVSRHKYVLDGAVIVDEVTVDTIGQALARFYFLTPVTDTAPGNTVTDMAKRGRELMDRAADRVGTDVQNMVMKKYPDTSHAKSLEYRVMSEADLTALHKSVADAWESGRGRKFSTK
jgi:hypothetical protein